MRKSIVTMWSNVPAPVKRWLKGLEVAVVSAVLMGCVAAPATDFSSSESITKFAAGLAATAYGAVRLYLTQSPVQNVVKEVELTKTIATPQSFLQQTSKTVTSGPPAPVADPAAGLDG